MPAAIIFGIIFLVSGILAIKKKRLGYEDGMRMSPPIKENTAVLLGVTERTIREWIRLNKPPIYAIRLIKLFSMELSILGNEWRGFKLTDGGILTPEGIFCTAGDIRTSIHDTWCNHLLPVLMMREIFPVLLPHLQVSKIVLINPDPLPALLHETLVPRATLDNCFP